MDDEDGSTVLSNDRSDASTSSSDGEDDNPEIDANEEADSVQEGPLVIPFNEEVHLDNEIDEQHNIEIDDGAQSIVAEEMIEPNTKDPGVHMSDEESIDMESTGVPGPTDEEIFQMAEQHGRETAVSGQDTGLPQT